MNSRRPNSVRYPLRNKRKLEDDLPQSSNKPIKKFKNSPVSFCDLPNEIILKIFGNLPTDTLVTASMVCHRWRVLARDPLLWTNIVIDENIPTASVLNYISIAPRLKYFSAKNRNDIDTILSQISKVCKNLEAIKLENCRGTPTTSVVHSKFVCRLMTKCRNLCNIQLENVRFTSTKFFKLLIENKIENPLKEYFYKGPCSQVISGNDMEIYVGKYKYTFSIDMVLDDHISIKINKCA